MAIVAKKIFAKPASMKYKYLIKLLYLWLQIENQI